MAYDIRSLYRPVQPHVKVTDNYISYQEFLPDAELQQDIYCYWQLHTHQSLEKAFTYRVVADGCIDIFFEVEQPQESFVMGFCKSFTAFELDRHFNYFGIRFLPTKFPLLFGFNALEISNKSVPLISVLPQVANRLGETIPPQSQAKAICHMLDQLFLSLPKTEIDPRLEKALQIILKKQGNLTLENSLDIGLSDRQLRRLFEFYIGTSPKTFCNVVRFQRVLNAIPRQQTTRNPDLFLAAGYFDQAHFIKEFKRLYGITPYQALAT